MHVIYRLKASELDARFIEAIKAAFEDRDIEIAVTEVDETAYLLHSDANKQGLLEAIQNVKTNRNLIEVDGF